MNPTRQTSRRLLGAPLLLIACVLTIAATTPTLEKDWPREVEKAFKSIKPKECLDHMKILASDFYEGRSCGEEGGRKASEYIARRFEEMGLEPAGSIRGSYFQPFSVRMRRIEVGPIELSNRLSYTKKPGSKDDTYEYGDEFAPDSRSAELPANGTLVFLGTETAPVIADDLDLSGKIAVLAAAVPDEAQKSQDAADGESDEAEPSSDEPAVAGRGVWSVADELYDRGALGVILVTDDRDFEPSADDWTASAKSGSSCLPVLRLDSRTSDRLIKKCGGKLDQLLKKPDEVVELEKGRVRFEASRKGFEYGRGRNVVGILRGSDPELSKECVVVGAHFDHVGYARDPRLSNGKAGEIHNGSDDNSSGTTGIIEMAEAFCEHGIRPKRSIVFIAFDAEELGLLGSKEYAANPTKFPIDKTVCMINMDMISRNDAQKMFIGKVDEYAGLNRIVSDVAGHFGIELDPTGMKKYIQRSDQWSFMEKGVPAVFLYGGDHPQYHTEKDDVQLANPGKVVNITRLMFLAAYECANHDGSFGTK